MWTSRARPTAYSDGDREPELVRITNRTFRPSRGWHRVVNVFGGHCDNSWHHYAHSDALHRTRQEADEAIAFGVLEWGGGP